MPTALRADLVLLGHYHVTTKVGRGIWYAGSTDTFTFADDPDVAKGIVVLDSDAGELQHIALDGCRPLVTLDTIEALGLSPGEVQERVLAAAAAAPAGSVSRVFVDGVDPEAWRLVDGALVRDTAAHAMHFKPTPTFAGVFGNVDPAELELDGMPARWDRYLRDQDLTGYDRDRIHGLGHEYLSKALDENAAVKITRLYLRNYRVYEDEVDLELPGGLVGVYGLNGAGKSYLVESILWTIWGRSRTDKSEVRTTGVNGDCITEVEFEHEGHLYLVRRTVSGINHTVRAEAMADGMQVAASVTDVRRYLHTILGMDDTAFRASVFAEQKQVAAFSGRTPGAAARPRAPAARHHAPRHRTRLRPRRRPAGPRGRRASAGCPSRPRRPPHRCGYEGDRRPTRPRRAPRGPPSGGRRPMPRPPRAERSWATSPSSATRTNAWSRKAGGCAPTSTRSTSASSGSTTSSCGCGATRPSCPVSTPTPSALGEARQTARAGRGVRPRRGRATRPAVPGRGRAPGRGAGASRSRRGGGGPRREGGGPRRRRAPPRRCGSARRAPCEGRGPQR